MKDHKTLMKSLDYIFPFTLLYFQCFFFLLLALFVFMLFTPVRRAAGPIAFGV